MDSGSNTYYLRVKVPNEYGTIKKLTGKKILSTEEMQQVYVQNPKCLDYWINNTLYPIDPQTLCPPRFSDLSTLLQFIGDGHNGLLGYCHRLVMFNPYHQQMAFQLYMKDCDIQKWKDEYSNTLQLLENSKNDVENMKTLLEKLTMEITKLKQQLSVVKQTPLGVRVRRKNFKPLQELSLRGGGRWKRVHAIK